MSDEPRIPSSRDLPPERLQRRKEMLVSEIASTSAASARRVRRPIVALAALVLLLATGFGTYALTRGEPTHFDSIGCFEEADVRSNTTVIGNEAQDPIAACAELWRQGTIAPGGSVPRLEACVLETGAVGVFPGESAEVCNRLGIAPLSPEGRAELRRLGELQTAIRERLAGCAGASEARGLARTELDARGFAD